MGHRSEHDKLISAMSRTLGTLQHAVLELVLLERGVFEGKEDLSSPAAHSQETEFVVPKKDDTDVDSNTDSAGEPGTSRDFCSRILARAVDAIRAYENDPTNLDTHELVEEFVETLGDIVELARHGYWADQPGTRDDAAGAGESPTDADGDTNNGDSEEKAYVAGVTKYPPNSAEGAAFTKGWDGAFEWALRQAGRERVTTWRHGYSSGLEDFDKYAENLIDRVLKRADPAVHPGPVGSPPGEAAGE